MAEPPTLPKAAASDFDPAAGASLRRRVTSHYRRRNGDLRPARPPIAGSRFLRFAVSLLVGVLAIFTLGGGLALLLLWRQDQTSGVLSNQIQRAWDLIETLRRTESIVALAAVPLAAAWAGLTTLNVRRATGRRRNPVIAAVSIPAAVVGVWAIGSAVVEPADDWATATGGLILQALVVAVPLFVLERVSAATEGPRRPLRLAYIAVVGYIAFLHGLGALSTIVPTDDPDKWAGLAAYLIMAALIQILGAIAVNAGFGSIEAASAHRGALRKAFGENVLLQSQP